MSKIKNGDTVRVNYTGKLEDGSIFDSSLNEGREPLQSIVGQGQLIPGFENALIDMEINEKKTIEILPVDAYGEVIPEMIMEIPKEQIPSDIEIGAQLQGNGPSGPFNVRVVDIKENVVVVDANHPLAGKKLIFELEVVSIN
jgi:FKBP-type peptidyl-prolyl cis-trans isomerase SlpA